MRKEFITLILVVFVIFTLGLAGCGGGGGDDGGGDTAPQTISRLAVNPDQQEQLLSRVEFTTTGKDQIEAIEFYAPKNTHGSIAKSALIYVTGLDGATVIEFDYSGRPEEIYMPDGAQFRLEYPGGGHVLVSYSNPDGSFGVADVPLDAEMQGLLDRITIPDVSAAGLTDLKAGRAGDLRTAPPMQNTTEVRANETSETKFVEVSEHYVFIFRLHDHYYEDLPSPPWLSKPEIDCSSLNCEVISSSYVQRYESYYDQYVTMRVSETVELQKSSLYDNLDDCERIRDNTSGNMAAGGFALGTVGLVITCISATMTGPAMIVSGVATSLVSLAQNASQMGDTISCAEVVERKAAREQLAGEIIDIQLNLYTNNPIDIDPNTIRISDIAPFAGGYENKHLIDSNTFLFEISADYESYESGLSQYEECPVCPAVMAQSFSAEDSATRYALSTAHQPRPFYAPADYISRCGVDDGGDDGSGESESDYVVYYTDNVRCWGAPWLFVTDRESFNEWRSTASYSGGGIDREEEAIKIIIKDGFATFDEANDWICSRIIGTHYSYWCGGERAHWKVEGQDSCFRLGNLRCGDLSDIPEVEPCN